MACLHYARAAGISADLAGTGATPGQAHGALADIAALLSAADGTLESEHPGPPVVLLDGTGVRAGKAKNGTGANLAIGLTGRCGPAGRRRARSHLLGLSVGEDWSMLGPQLQHLPAPELVVLDGETAITALAQRLWPDAPIQRCWWHLAHGLRKAFYADDAANRHVNPHWARNCATELGELLREQIRHEHTTTEALAVWDAFTAAIPASLTSAHAYLAAARPHAFTCLDPSLRRTLAHLGGPELGTGVLERLMRELNARTDIGGSRWSVPGLRDLLTVLTARALHHPACKENQARHPPAEHHPLQPAETQRNVMLPTLPRVAWSAVAASVARTRIPNMPNSPKIPASLQGDPPGSAFAPDETPASAAIPSIPTLVTSVNTQVDRTVHRRFHSAETFRARVTVVIIGLLRPWRPEQDCCFRRGTRRCSQSAGGRRVRGTVLPPRGRGPVCRGCGRGC